MSAKRDYYNVLGVSREAGPEEIKKAYRQKARQHHPDVNKEDSNAAEKFKEISEAYSILSDPEKRQAYDTYGHDAFDPNGGFAGFDDFGGFGDIFDIFFGGGNRSGRRSGPQAGADREIRMEINFEDAVFGIEKDIELSRVEKCDHCNGNGAEPGTKIKTCPSCNGQGQVRSVQNTPFGRFETVRPCGKCRGDGRVIENPCRSCSGTGQVRKKRTISVRIPAGVDNGNRLRMQGEGEVGIMGGPPGDLYITLMVKPHSRFKREAHNLICSLEIDFVQAALGAELEIELLGGEKQKVKIPEGTQPGDVITVRGKGVPFLQRNKWGDLKLRTDVKIPTKLSKRQRELLAGFYDPEEKQGKKNIINKFRDAMG